LRSKRENSRVAPSQNWGKKGGREGVTFILKETLVIVKVWGSPEEKKGGRGERILSYKRGNSGRG